jgi:hypothetical protein
MQSKPSEGGSVVYRVKRRVYGRAADGRTVLLFTTGSVITDDEARAAGLLRGVPAAKAPARGLVVESERRDSDEAPPPAKPLSRMNLAELHAVCGEEGVDVEGLGLRAELIEAIEAAREYIAGIEGDGDAGDDED